MRRRELFYGILALSVLIVVAIILPLWVRSDMPSEANLDNLIGNFPQVAELTQDNILLRLSTDKTVYEPGENVLITACVKNLSSQAIGFTYSPAGKIAISVSSTEYPSDLRRYAILLKDGNKTQMVPNNFYGDILGAGESITRETFWDQKFLDGASEFDAPFGRYTLAASFVGLPPSIMVMVTIWAGSFEG